MKFSTILSVGLIPAVALGAFSNVTSSSPPIVPPVSSNGTSVSYTTETEVVTAYTTYCPYPTTIVTNGGTYTVTAPTTLTITNCPCTLTHTIPYTTSSAGSGTTSTLVTSSAAQSATSSVIIVPNGAANMIVPPFLGAAGIAVLLL